MHDGDSVYNGQGLNSANFKDNEVYGEGGVHALTVPDRPAVEHLHVLDIERSARVAAGEDDLRSADSVDVLDRQLAIGIERWVIRALELERRPLGRIGRLDRDVAKNRMMRELVRRGRGIDQE